MALIDNQILDKHFDGSAARARLAEAVPEAVRKRAAFLLEPERTLFQLLADGSVSRRQVARMLKVPPGTLTRRVQKLANRLHDPLVVALLDNDRCPLASEYRQLGIEHFLQGRTIRNLSDRHRISASKVRDMIQFIRGWHSSRATRVEPPACMRACGPDRREGFTFQTGATP
jgi:hypothetical protein